MQYQRRHFGLAQAAKAAGALLSLGLILTVSLLAASPDLHRLAHHDADSADHHCAVTLFTHGKVHCMDAQVAVVVSLRFTPHSESSPAAPFIFSDAPPLPCRGPPAV